MSLLLEILGRAITVDTADLILHWLDSIKTHAADDNQARCKQLETVIGLLAERKVDSAEEQLKFYIFENPDCSYGRMAAAAVCLYKNSLENAIEQLNSVYMRQPGNTMALYALGHCYERISQEAEAVEFYQDCLKFKNYLQFPRQRLAAIYFKNGQLDRTIQEYEFLKKEYPNDIQTLVTLGNLYIANAQYDEAIETFNVAILIHPDNSYASDDQIDQLIQQGSLDEALEMIDDLLTGQPESSDLLIRRADVLNILGNDQEAIEYYEYAIRAFPDSLEATIKLGTKYLQSQQYIQAARQFNKAAEINDQIVDSYVGLATAQKLSGSITEATGTFSLAAAIQPNTALLFAETANLQFRSSLESSFASDDDIDVESLTGAAITAHRQQISLHPENPDLYYRLALLEISSGNFKEAVKNLRTCLDINPTFGRANSKLAISLFQTNRKKQALELLTAPDYIDAKTLNLHYKTALLYCDKIKFASSLLNLYNIMQSNFASMDTTTNISVVLQNLGLLARTEVMWDNLSNTTNESTSIEPLN